MQNTSHNEMKKVVSKLMKDNPKYKEKETNANDYN